MLLINGLNEFTDNAFTFGESILKKMEESGLNDKLKVTADKLDHKVKEVFKKTRDSISSINQSSKVAVFKDRASEKISSIGGRIWGFFGKNQDNNKE